MIISMYLFIYALLLLLEWGGVLINRPDSAPTPSPPTKSLDFRGFDSSRLLILRGGILMSVEFDQGSPGKFDSRTLYGKTLSRWTLSPLSSTRRTLDTANFQTKNLQIWSLSQTNSSTKEVDFLRARLISYHSGFGILTQRFLVWKFSVWKLPVLSL